MADEEAGEGRDEKERSNAYAEALFEQINVKLPHSIGPDETNASS